MAYSMLDVPQIVETVILFFADNCCVYLSLYWPFGSMCNFVMITIRLSDFVQRGHTG